MGASFSASAEAGALAVTLPVPPAATFPPETFPETEAVGPLADRLASPALDRRVGGEAVAPVAARVGFGTALLLAAFLAAALPLLDASAACVAPVAASDALVLLVVTAVILAL
jgi:hypothetical protein